MAPSKVWYDTKTIHIKRYANGCLASLDGGEYIPVPFTPLAPMSAIRDRLGALHPNATIYEVGR